MNSAILTGGIEQLGVAIVAAGMLLVWVPETAGNGWTRWRVAGFFLLWQAFTPLRAWYIDLPLLVLATAAMEAAFRTAARRLKLRAS